MRQPDPPWLVVLFFGVQLLIMAPIANFYLRVKPRALDRWAQGLGCRIVGRYRPALMGLVWRVGLPWFGEAPPFGPMLSNSQELLRFTLRDGQEQEYRCWMKLGRFWGFPLSAERCPIEVRWIGKSPGPFKPEEVAEVAHPLRDREIDG